MKITNEKQQEYSKRLLASRMRIMCNHGFFGLLLMHLKYGISPTAPTAYTDGKKIVFGAKFLEKLSDKEVDFVMMHEVMHIALQHCFRGTKYDADKFNIACDIVVNSNILLENGMDLQAITLSEYGEAMHLTPNGDEGYNYTAEQVYQMLPDEPPPQGTPVDGDEGYGGDEQVKAGQADKNSKVKQGASDKSEKDENEQSACNETEQSTWDDHEHWACDDQEDLSDTWIKRVQDAGTAIEIKKKVSGIGDLPLFAKRLLKEIRSAQTDWRTVLAQFIQEIVTDYSLFPPDYRYSETPYYLPAFNGAEVEVKDILFMVDTSASMNDEMLTLCYSEVKGAIDQFDGKLRGWLGFFDAGIVEPVPFNTVEEFTAIHPAGGGGTRFDIIFKYVNEYMTDNLPACIIILTDGYAKFPPESDALGIPVLWTIVQDPFDDESVEVPWGKVIRIENTD